MEEKRTCCSGVKQTVAALADFLSVSSEDCSFFIESYDPSENQRNSCHQNAAGGGGGFGAHFISIFEKSKMSVLFSSCANLKHVNYLLGKSLGGGGDNLHMS